MISILVRLWRNDFREQAVRVVARGLEFTLDRLGWSAGNHEEFSAVFREHIAGPGFDDEWERLNT